jgi:serine/threonine protein kinase
VYLSKKKGNTPNTTIGGYYACKVLSLRQAQSTSQMNELEKEVDILSSLDHANIIKLHCALKTVNNLYLFLDFCD